MFNQLRSLSATLLATSILSFGFLSTFALAAEQAPVKPILGAIQMGQTPVAEFEQAMKEKGCTVENKGDYVTVQPGCFQLPGNPEINAGVGMDKTTGKIEAVVLKFDRGEDLVNYGQFLSTLVKKYGEPVYIDSNLKGGEAVWHGPFGGIVLILKEGSAQGALAFLSEPIYNAILQEKLPEVYKTKDLEIL